MRPTTESRDDPALPTPALSTQERRRFEELALPYLGALYRLAVRLLGEPRDAEDVVQETYLKALRAFPTLRDPQRIRPWLCQILSRLVLDRQRSGSPEVAVDELEELDRFSLYDVISDEDPFPYSDQLHEDFLAQFPDEHVRAALLRLPEAYRVPLLLLYLEELSYQEIADLLGCPLGTVMSRLHRARKILERELWEWAKQRGLVRTWRR